MSALVKNIIPIDALTIINVVVIISFDKGSGFVL